jgi:hypothetical protein
LAVRRDQSGQACPLARLRIRDLLRIKTIARLLHQGCQPLRVLIALACPLEVKVDFLGSGGHKLAEVSYTPFDPTLTIEALVAVVTRLLDSAPVVRMPSAA